MTMLFEYYNQEQNFITYVAQSNKGFAVGILDLDANQYLGAINIFKDLLPAKEYAQKCATFN